MDIKNEIIDFYENKYNEDGREERESLEFVRSKSIISGFLGQKAMDIADVCGATGVYSFWLARMGHKVHLMDLVPKHIDIAKSKSETHGIRLASCGCADARRLPYGDESMDMVLLMGALYHLRAGEERAKCLSEAFRVLRRGGIVLCTVINRYTLLISALKYNLFEKYGMEYFEEAMRTGVYGGVNLPNAYGHAPGEIAREIAAAGFVGIEQFAVEGVANILNEKTLPEDEQCAARILKCAELTQSVPELQGVSRNIMAVGKKPF